MIVCPRCKREAVGWPLRRLDKCSPQGWVVCLREPSVIGAEVRRPLMPLLRQSKETGDDT